MLEDRGDSHGAVLVRVMRSEQLYQEPVELAVPTVRAALKEGLIYLVLVGSSSWHVGSCFARVSSVGNMGLPMSSGLCLGVR